MIRYEDVKDQTTEDYFQGNQFSIDAFNKKYALNEGESYVQALKRVCDYIASAEDSEKKKKYWSERWFDEIYNDWWHAAGSIMQGAGSGKAISLSNCTTLSLGNNRLDEEWDNLESIIKNTAFSIAKCAAFRQGLGVDFSRLRPIGTKVLNSSNESQGAIHWMKFLDSIGYYVGQKGRIPASLYSLSVSHPDIIDFIKIKEDKIKIQNANISVQCTNDFYSAVIDDKDWELSFEIPEVRKGQKVYIDVHSTDMDSQYDEKKKKWYYVARKTRPYEKISKIVKAREILGLIAKGMCQYGEPGIQNIDIARKYSNSDYVYDSEDLYNTKICSTNACSEQMLSREGLCVLSSINAGKFSVDPSQYEKELDIIGHSINRFLDNVNEMELQGGTYATAFQKIGIEKMRRTGAGFTNLAGWLFKKNLEYGSDNGNQAIAHFVERYNYYLYKSSIELGKEKGNFELFNREKLEQSPFIKRMIKLGLEFNTLRNITCSSVAPSGTLSLMFRDLIMSYGIEPSFGMYFWKRTRMSGKYEYYFCVPHLVKEYFAQNGIRVPMKADAIKDTWNGEHGKPIAQFIDEKAKDLNIKFKNATEISALNKLDLMSKVMKSIDSSISVTYMLPENSDWKDVYDFILEAYKKEVKSVAAFPDRKMYGIVSYIPFKDLAVKLKKENIEIHNQNFTEEEIKELDSILKTQSTTCGAIDNTDNCDKFTIKRPKVLPCDIHHVKVTKKLDKIRTFEYLVIIGLIDGNRPYETFCTENGQLSKNYTKGEVVKHGRGRYNLVLPDGVELKDITKDNQPSEDSVSRLTSCLLRHGVPVNFIVDQLEKAEDNMFCFSKSIAKALKRYIPSGTIVKGMTCPSCGKAELTRAEGCILCNCGWSKCS